MKFFFSRILYTTGTPAIFGSATTVRLMIIAVSLIYQSLDISNFLIIDVKYDF